MRIGKKRAILFFFFNDTATTEIYTLSLHDALPIFYAAVRKGEQSLREGKGIAYTPELEDEIWQEGVARRSEEHTSELQSRQYLVCRLLLEKKKINGSNKDKYDERHNARVHASRFRQ